MLELIDTIKCNITILANWLPMYKITLVTYLASPVIILTYYRTKNPKAKEIFLVVVLIVIWVFQIMIWNTLSASYYIS